MLVGCVLGLERQTLGVHLDRLVRSANRQAGIDRDIAAHLKHNARNLVGFEALGSDHQVIRRDGDIRKRVQARIVCLGRVRHACRRFNKRDSCAGNRSPRRVSNGALDVTRSGNLTVTLGGEQKHCHKAQKDRRAGDRPIRSHAGVSHHLHLRGIDSIVGVTGSLRYPRGLTTSATYSQGYSRFVKR